MSFDELIDKYISKAERRMPLTWEGIERFISRCKEDMIKNEVDDITINDVVDGIFNFLFFTVPLERKKRKNND